MLRLFRSDHFDFAGVELVDAALDAHFAGLDGVTDDIRPLFQFSHAEADILLDGGGEEIARMLAVGGIYRGLDRLNQLRQMARQFLALARRLHRRSNSAAARMAKHHDERHVEDRDGELQTGEAVICLLYTSDAADDLRV